MASFDRVEVTSGNDDDMQIYCLDAGTVVFGAAYQGDYRSAGEDLARIVFDGEDPLTDGWGAGFFDSLEEARERRSFEDGHPDAHRLAAWFDRVTGDYGLKCSWFAFSGNANSPVSDSAAQDVLAWIVADGGSDFVDGFFDRRPAYAAARGRLLATVDALASAWDGGGWYRFTRDGSPGDAFKCDRARVFRAECAYVAAANPGCTLGAERLGDGSTPHEREVEHG